MSLIHDISARVTEQYRHLWIHRKTGELALSTNSYTLVNGRKKTIEIDVSREGRGHHARLSRFERSWAYVCEGWKVRKELKSRYS